MTSAASSPNLSPAARGPAVGLPEVVAMSLPDRTAPGEVRAVLVGARIDTRSLADFTEPGRVETTGAVFAFRYGVLVFFGASPETEARIIGGLAASVLEPVPVPEVETAVIQIVPGAEEQIDANGRITLREATPERLLLTATVLARSVVLARDEGRFAEAFDRIEPVVTALRQKGRVGLPIRRVMQHIGDVMAAQHRVVGRVQVGEKPDLLWDCPELDRLYARLEAEFELTERARVIERKLEVIGDAADVLLDIVQDKRSVRLELAIIWLIAFEIVLTLYEMWRG